MKEISELNDQRIEVPFQTDPKKEVHEGLFMTDSGHQSFAKGEGPTNREFEGAKGTETLEEWMQGKKAVKHPQSKDMPAI